MKKILYVASAVAFMACGSSKNASNDDANVDQAAKYAATITAKDLGAHLFTYASDEFEGRNTGEPGQKKAVEYLKNFYVSEGIVSPLGGDDYFQEVPAEWINKNTRRGKFKDSENVVAFIKGTEKPEEIVVISAHLDHEGIKNGEIYNGADDDASGTAALFAIAAYFKKHKPKHTLVFAAVDAEEIGSLGADYWLKNYPNKKDIVLNVNMDMIAHNDSNELYACGTYHYPQLKAPLQNLASPINLLFGHDNPEDKTKDDWTLSSDHRIFHKEKIPFIYFGVEDHKDYHKPTDTFKNINQQFYIEAVKLIIEAIEKYDTVLE